MKSKQQVFFLTKSDIIKMMSVVEENFSVEYILMGSFEHEVIRRETSISNFEDLGYTNYSNWISLDNRYMVIPLDEDVKLSTGGIYKKTENVLIAGRVAVFTDLSKESMLIYKEIVKAMNKCFTKRNNVFVSEEALLMLGKGWRLTCNYNASCENDFR